MADFEVVIVGGGLASARAVASYREAGGGGRVALVSRDTVVPYHRPPLSKRFLRGEAEREDTLVQPEEWYREHDVEVMLESEATRLDAGERRLELRDGTRVGYANLLLATGSTPRRLPVPGHDLERVLLLRTLDDSAAIREAARGASQAVVVGAGFIGMEVTASLTALGVAVTMIHRGSGLFELLRSPELSRWLLDLYRQKGVDVLVEDEVAAFDGDGRVSRVRTKGGRGLDADLVVVGVGVSPATELAEDARLDVDDGIVVNERFEAGADGVWAVGDAARFLDPLFGRRRRIEHWSNANYTGTEVGKLLTGADGGYDTVSSFFSEVFGTTVKVFGDVDRHDALVYRGAFESGSAIGFYLDGGRLVATVLTGQEEETETELKRLIGERANIRDARALEDAGTPLESAFDAGSRRESPAATP